MARYALVVGISEYKHLPSPLSKTLGDATTVADLLRSHGDFQEVILLNKSKLTKAELFAQLKRLLIDQASGSEVLIYYTGHGVLVENCEVQEGYLAPSDCDANRESVANGIPFSALNNLIGQSQLSGLVVLLDCCHSGFLLKSAAETFTALQKTDKNYALIAACRDFEEAAAMRSQPHSIFTGVLLQGLAPENANADGQINSSTLFGFIEDHLQQKGQESIKLVGGRRIKVVDYRAVKPPEKPTEDVCPYVGLEAFTKETAKFFKGRDRFVTLLLEKREKSPLVPVIGASGSGKSSLVKAGLIPELEARGNWLILPPIKPGDFSDNPAMGINWALAQICQRADTKREISKAIASGNLEAAIAYLPEHQNILLIVDQFEEVFTVCPPDKEAERQQFIDLLVGITQYPNSRLRVVTTMRADFFENCLAYRGLGEVLQKHQVLLLPMNEKELEDAIALPAQVGQYELGEGLLPAILRDVRHEKNVLPLLEFALTQLWENREKRRLTFAVYDALCGVMGALNNHAKHIYDALQPQQQEWAKRICLRLVRTGLGERDTRQRRTKRELTQLVKDGDLQDFQVALDQLVTGRLLVTGQDGDGAAWVDLAHEALMEKWDYFAKWREEKREVLRLVNRICDAFDECQQVIDQDKFLLPEGVVAQIEEVESAINDYLTPEQQQFVQRNQYKYKPWLDPDTRPELSDVIPSGTFWMGSPEGKGYSSEKPYHQVTVPAFRMGKYPITQAHWYAIAKSPQINRELNLFPSYHRGDHLPVEQVSWHEAQEFCDRLSRLTGDRYRLPTEAEWEYACRAGAKDYTEYCFGDDVSQLGDYAWYGNNSGDRLIDAAQIWQDVNQNSTQYGDHLRATRNRTRAVGGRLANAWGLYDMHGNVWEWCLDEWHENYSEKPDNLKQNGDMAWDEINDNDNDNRYHLLRGGSWNHFALNCRSANRLRLNADHRNLNLGFRVVVSVLSFL